ncbi:MAG: hypothetical protein WEA04_03110 [Candidatus Andersenbacteria bacterium]
MKRLGWYIVSGIVVVVVTAGTMWYIQRPATIAERSITALARANTAHFKAMVELANDATTEALLGESGTVEFIADGVFARHDNERDALQADITLTTKTESVSVTVEGEVRFIGDKAFLYIKASPPIFALLNQLKGQWLELPRGEEGNIITMSTPERYFVEVKRQGIEQLQGKSVVKYEAVAADAAVISMMDAIAELLGTRLTQDQISNIRQSVDQVGQVPVELWIKRWSQNLRQLRAVLEVPGGNNIQFTLATEELNEKVDIVAPPNAVDINDAVRAVIQPSATPLPPPPVVSPTPVPTP